MLQARVRGPGERGQEEPIGPRVAPVAVKGRARQDEREGQARGDRRVAGPGILEVQRQDAQQGGAEKAGRLVAQQQRSGEGQQGDGQRSQKRVQREGRAVGEAGQAQGRGEEEVPAAGPQRRREDRRVRAAADQRARQGAMPRQVPGQIEVLELVEVHLMRAGNEPQAQDERGDEQSQGDGSPAGRERRAAGLGQRAGIERQHGRERAERGREDRRVAVDEEGH